MLKTAATEKNDSIENRQSGMEGLAVAVIETAVKDLEESISKKRSAIYFLKNCPELVEFWLSVATHKGNRNIDVETAQKKLYAKAVEAEMKKVPIKTSDNRVHKHVTSKKLSSKGKLDNQTIYKLNTQHLR